MIKKRNGFTLVEMLVVIVLLSMLIATAVFAYKNMIINIKHTKKENYKFLYSFHQLRSSITSMSYYVIYDEEKLSVKSGYKYFFNGNSQTMHYITKNPVFSDKISVVSLACENNELTYSETLLYGEQDYLQPQVDEKSPIKILFDDVSDCSIDYFLKNQKMKVLQNSIPELVHIALKINKKEQEFLFRINSTRDKVNELIAGAIDNEN